MWHFVLARAQQCLLRFSIESKSSNYPWFEPLCSPPRNAGIQDDFLRCPWCIRFHFGKRESWGRQRGDGQDTGSQEFRTQHFYLSNLHFQDSLVVGTWPRPFPSSTAFLEFVKKLKTASSSHPTCLVIPAYLASTPITYLTFIVIILPTQ